MAAKLLRPAEWERMDRQASPDPGDERASLRAENAALRARLAQHGTGCHERVLSALANVVYVYDLQADEPVYFNPAGGRRLGYTATEMQAMGSDIIMQLAHPEDVSRMRAHLLRLAALRDGEHASQEYRLRDRQGQWRWFEAHNAVLQRHADGSVWQVVGTATEITARKHAERALLENASRLRLQVDQAPMAVIEWSRDRIVQRWGGEAERMFGWTASEACGRPMRELDLVHPDDRAGVEQVVQELLGGAGGAVTWTNRNLSRDRRVLHCTWHNSLLPSSQDHPEGLLLSLVLDVTEHQRAEHGLRISEERHRLLAETMLQGVVHQGADGRIIAMNPAAERILGKSRERFMGSDSVQEEHDTVRADGTPFPGEEHPSMVALRTGEPVRGVVMGVWNPRLAQRRWLRIDSVPVVREGEANGRAVEVYAVFEDITEQRRAEEALREADRQKDLFIATLAHELRNPLAPILNAATVLRAHAPADAATAQCSAVIERQVAHMARLLDDLLDVSRVASGRLLLRPEQLQLQAVVDQAIETARPLITAAGHTLALHLPAEPLLLRGDRLRLAQVVANLLTNAAKYTQAHGRITVTGAREGDDVVVCVRDSGIGLANEHLKSVFEMFGQVDAALERSQGGLGIGLALAKGLVEMHGGSIRAHSDGPGRGSEFIVRLPAAANMPAGGAAAPALSVPVPAADAPGLRVLVVDDNRDAAETLALLLSVEGHQVKVEHDGADALAQARTSLPQVALLDLGMPRLNGYDLCRALRGLPGGEGIVIAAVTGWGQDLDRTRTREAGFDHHLVKPVQFDQLRRILAAASGLAA